LTGQFDLTYSNTNGAEKKMLEKLRFFIKK